MNINPSRLPAGRQIWRTVSAVGALVASLVLAACGGAAGDTSQPVTPGAAPSAADLTLQLSAATLLNSGSDTVTATATAVDANRNLLPNVPITLRVDNSATALVSGASTDATGKVTAQVGVGADKSNRVVTVTATSGSLVRSVLLQVSGSRLSGTALPSSITPSTAGAVIFKLADINSSPIAQQDIVVAGVGGVETRAKTDLNGEYRYDYTSPAATGTLDLRATAAGVTITQSIVVLPAAGVVAPVAEAVRSASMSLSANRVPVNFIGTSNRVDVRTLFLHASNKPAAGVRVRFYLPDPNSVGGTLSTGSALLYADSFGVVNTTYVPGARSSPTDGVTVRACWHTQDFAVDAICPPERTMEAKLTVMAEPLSVSIGTDKIIERGATRIDYVKRFLVQVNDASGAPKADADLSASIDLLSYYTGTWITVYDAVTDSRNWVWNPDMVAGECSNEDLNRNGAVDQVAVLEGAGSVSEDASGNGQLDPRKADVVVAFEGAARTDSRGQAVVRISYPQNVASWVNFKLDVVARGVAGSEGRAWFSGLLPVLAEDVSDGETTPAFVFSPYNVATGLQGRTYTHASPPPGAAATFRLCSVN